MVAKTAAFEKAVTDSRKLKAKPTSDELLEVRFLDFFSLSIASSLCNPESHSG